MRGSQGDRLAWLNRRMAAETIARVQGISKSYGRNAALRDVSFSIRSGELLGLIGPNGAGKTTLFECVAGVQPADSGEITLQTDCGPPIRRSSVLFYLPDGIVPWPDQPVGWALEFCLGFFGGRRNLYEDVVRDLSLRELLRARIGELSKGQRKRVLLGMGLLMPQTLLLIDEPFEGLDLRQSRDVTATLQMQVSLGRTLFVSIHQIGDAARVCDRFVLLSNGRVAAEGTQEELTALATARLGCAPPSDFEEVFLALT
jgi:ABC-2 type transport system ATP-binding protein